MTRVIIESPFAGSSPAGSGAARKEQERNVAYARAAMKDCLDRGEAPFASHLLYPQVYDDDDPKQRRAGIEAGLRWGKHAELTVVYDDLGVSRGMKIGIDRAIYDGRPVVYRTLGAPWNTASQ